MKNFILILLPKFTLKVLLVYTLLTVFVFLVFNWIPISTTAFIQLKSCNSFTKNLSHKTYKQKWVKIDDVNKNFLMSVIASEDQKFATHFGFDVKQIEIVIKEHSEGKRIRGASTITQQLAKNIFLWPSKNIFRKGFEVYYTIIMELLWSKKRILEVYVNVIELGKNIYGVEAAAKYYFHKSAKSLNKEESALLAASLPNPIRYSVQNPSEYMLRRSQRIIEQINNLGGQQYLQNIIN